MIGVDEAGKGPAIGSMFAGAIRVSSSESLPDGITDSKELSASERERLYQQLQSSDAVEIGVGEVTVDEIDDPRRDMNSLTVTVQARALSDVVSSGERVIVDAGDTDAQRFARRVANTTECDIEVVGEHEADASYTVVGAASIVAKEAREAHVRELSRGFGDVGSGYPSDPQTQAFLEEFVEEHGELPSCARSSWETCQDVLSSVEQRGLSDFE